MSQKITHQQPNISSLFDYFDCLYFETSDIKNNHEKNLFAFQYPLQFKPLINLFSQFDAEFSKIETTQIHFLKLEIQKYNPKNIIVCFSGGKDSIVTALHYKKLGYNVYLYHLKGINKAYPKEYESAEKLANKMNLPLYIEEIKLSGNHIYTEHPMKNMIIVNRALQFGIKNNIGIKIAVGNYYNAQLKDTAFSVCAGDCKDMWTIYENIIKTILPKFNVYIFLKNINSTYKEMKNHKRLLELSYSCLSPHRYRKYWKGLVEKKYKIKLPQNRCGLCWKCAFEYIYYADNNVYEYNENYYIHCLEVLLHNEIKEYKQTNNIYDLWCTYFPYGIEKSKWKDIYYAIIQGRKITSEQ